MFQAQTVLVEHEPKSLKGRNGPYTLHIFKAQDGERFQTTKTAIANAAYGLLNQAVTIGYEQQQRGDWTNNVIEQIEAGNVALAAAPTGAPTGAAPTGAAPTSAPASSGGGGMSPDRELRVMRQNGLANALATVDAGLFEATSIGDVIKLADKYVRYYQGGAEAVLGQAAGSGQAQQAAAPQAVGGDAAVAEAPASAPTATSPAEPVAAQADDDIPF